MRGGAMMAVVMFHVLTLSFAIDEKSSSVISFLQLFMLPLFFTISGYLVNKDSKMPGATLCQTNILVRLMKLIVPTIFFFVMYICLRCDNFYHSASFFLSTDAKGGYWFTISLIQMFIIYYMFHYLYRKHRGRLSEN